MSHEEHVVDVELEPMSLGALPEHVTDAGAAAAEAARAGVGADVDAESAADRASLIAPEGPSPSEAAGASGHGHGPVVKQGPVPAIANLVNCILAAGAVGGPYALANAGMPLGIIAYIAVAILMDYSLVTLVGTAISTQIFDYQGMCQKAFGKPGYIILSLVQWGQGYGCMVAYLMIAGDTAESIVHMCLSLTGTEGSGFAQIVVNRKLIIATIFFVCVLPICFLKDITSLAKTSYLSIVSVVFIAASVLIRCMLGVNRPVNQEEPPACFKFAHMGFMEGLGVAAFSFVTHHESLIVFKGLKKETIENWSNIAHYSMLTALCALLLISITGYLTFFDLSDGNVLNNYPSDDYLLQMAKACFGVTMVLTYPLEHFVSRTVAIDIVSLVWKKGSHNAKFYAVTFVLVLSSLGIALFITQVGSVLALTGGVCAATLAYIMPGLLYLKLEKRKTRANKYICMGLVTLGFLLVVGCPSWVVYRLLSGEEVHKGK
eukprot:m51a1_g222 hypothetical protein (489) ;mRNA; r:48577-50841